MKISYKTTKANRKVRFFISTSGQNSQKIGYFRPLVKTKPHFRGVFGN
ncbi:hypothetical protein X875_20970 [Mannheimia varigena USDA-ARS-USMARC-1388]|nr:hypothetical protein X875_20970 [Mannheimia varigena USDA-ARS-USMARC-1388]